VRKIAVLLITGLAFINTANADTVFIVFAGIDEQLIEHNEQVKNIIYSLESGAMDVFFDAGHIISNSGYSHVDQKDALRLGKNVAADYLLVLQANFENKDDEYALLSVSYRYLNVVSEQEIFSSVETAGKLYESADFFQACRNLGAEMAQTCVY
jgi:hypothetical protein